MKLLYTLPIFITFLTLCTSTHHTKKSLTFSNKECCDFTKGNNCFCKTTPKPTIQSCTCNAIKSISFIYLGQHTTQFIKFYDTNHSPMCKFTSTNKGEEVTCNPPSGLFTPLTTFKIKDKNGQICSGTIDTSCKKSILNTHGNDCEDIVVSGYTGIGNEICDDGYAPCTCDGTNAIFKAIKPIANTPKLRLVMPAINGVKHVFDTIVNTHTNPGTDTEIDTSVNNAPDSVEHKLLFYKGKTSAQKKHKLIFYDGNSVGDSVSDSYEIIDSVISDGVISDAMAVIDDDLDGIFEAESPDSLHESAEVKIDVSSVGIAAVLNGELKDSEQSLLVKGPLKDGEWSYAALSFYSIFSVLMVNLAAVCYCICVKRRYKKWSNCRKLKGYTYKRGFGVDLKGFDIVESSISDLETDIDNDGTEKEAL